MCYQAIIQSELIIHLYQMPIVFIISGHPKMSLLHMKRRLASTGSWAANSSSSSTDYVTPPSSDCGDGAAGDCYYSQQHQQHMMIGSPASPWASETHMVSVKKENNCSFSL